MQGFIDDVQPGGLIEGWARDDADPRPRHVLIRLGAQLLAEAYAGEFRRDLLAAGIGHGHHAFYARLRVKLPPGEYRLLLVDAATQIVINGPDGSLKRIPELRREQVPVEATRSRRAEWNDADVLAHLDCLRLAENRERLGTPRFVDYLCHYVLGRWPGPEEATAYAAAIDQGELSPEGYFRDLMLSAERQARPQPLASPHEPQFPLDLG